MTERCDCGRDEATIQTTDDGGMCAQCFDEKYEEKFNGEKINRNLI